MPTYTYECKKCAERQDRFHAISAKPRVKCEACGGPCKRLIGMGAGLIFKGSGFYETDYKTKNGRPDEAKTAETSGAESTPCDNCPAKKSAEKASATTEK